MCAYTLSTVTTIKALNMSTSSKDFLCPWPLFLVIRTLNIRISLGSSPRPSSAAGRTSRDPTQAPTGREHLGQGHGFRLSHHSGHPAATGGRSLGWEEPWVEGTMGGRSMGGRSRWLGEPRVYKLVKDMEHRPKDYLELTLTQSVEALEVRVTWF